MSNETELEDKVAKLEEQVANLSCIVEKIRKHVYADKERKNRYIDMLFND